MLCRRTVNERATCRQIERDGVAVKNDTQAPFASEVATYIAGQSAYEACARQHKKTERPLHREGDGSKADHDTGDAHEKDHPKEGEHPRRERHPKNAPLVRVGARRNSSGAIGNVVHDWTPDEASYRNRLRYCNGVKFPGPTRQNPTSRTAKRTADPPDPDMQFWV